MQRSEKWVDANVCVDIVFAVNQTTNDDVELIQSLIRDRRTKIRELFCKPTVFLLLAKVGGEIME